MKSNSWSNMAIAWTTSTGSWLDSQPLRLKRCSVSRTLRHTSFSIYPNSPMWSPSSVTSTGVLLRPSSNLRWRCWPSQGRQQNYTHLPPNTGQTTCPSGSTSPYSISWLVPPSLKANKACYGTTQSGMNSRPVSGITRHVPQKTQEPYFDHILHDYLFLFLALLMLICCGLFGQNCLKMP